MVSADLLLFLIWLNFLPFLAHLLLGERWAWPLDASRRLWDGRPILGSHKTLRGVLAALAGGTVAAPLLGLPWTTALLAAALAMLGDLLTSFLKRRLEQPSGKPIFALDQGLEGGLPLLVLAPAMGLSWWQGPLAWVMFMPLSYAGAWYWHYVLYRPPVANYPRLVRSSTRLREWRACHAPLARWQTWLNFESYVYYRVVMAHLFKATGWYRRGMHNALRPEVSHHDLPLGDLPAAFDGYRILLLTDLHLDGLATLTDALIERVAPLELDLCLVGGDVRMEMYGPMAPAIRELKRLVAEVHARDGVYGVLGNHDCIEMLPEFEQAGVSMLVNDSRELRRGGSSIWLAGVDDPHYYRCHDLELALRRVPPEGFKLLLAHSPEIYREAAIRGFRLYLCGHTHGGQICLPVVGPVFTHSRAPRHTAAGQWIEGRMLGFTSRGAGASGLPLRFNCPGEVAVLTLRAAGPALPN